MQRISFKILGCRCAWFLYRTYYRQVVKLVLPQKVGRMAKGIIGLHCYQPGSHNILYNHFTSLYRSVSVFPPRISLDQAQWTQHMKCALASIIAQNRKPEVA